MVIKICLANVYYKTTLLLKQMSTRAQITERRDAMWTLLSNLEMQGNSESNHDNTDKEVTNILKSIDSRDFREPPNHSWIAKFPVWETVCIACKYANLAGWDMPPSRIIQGYLPNNEKGWFKEFRIKWDGLRVLDTTSGEDLLNLIKAPRF